jgi:GNAT superfamily N-acetyltransferase
VFCALNELVKYSFSQFDPCEEYNVDFYLNGFGLCTKSEYRGRNIAKELLLARAPFLKALGLTVTATFFSGIGSQKAAVKAGYTEVFSME